MRMCKKILLVYNGFPYLTADWRLQRDSKYTYGSQSQNKSTSLGQCTFPSTLYNSVVEHIFYIVHNSLCLRSRTTLAFISCWICSMLPLYNLIQRLGQSIKCREASLTFIRLVLMTRPPAVSYLQSKRRLEVVLQTSQSDLISGHSTAFSLD